MGAHRIIIIIIIIIWILKKWCLYVILRVFNVAHLCGGNQCWVGTRYPAFAGKNWTTIKLGLIHWGEPYFICLKEVFYLELGGIEIEIFDLKNKII